MSDENRMRLSPDAPGTIITGHTCLPAGSVLVIVRADALANIPEDAVVVAIPAASTDERDLAALRRIETEGIFAVHRGGNRFSEGAWTVSAANGKRCKHSSLAGALELYDRARDTEMTES